MNSQKFSILPLVLLNAMLTSSVCDGQGTFDLSNYGPLAGIDAPVFDATGRNRLEGTSYLCNLYAGLTTDSLQPVGAPVSFLTGSSAGYFLGGVRELRDPFIPGGMFTWVQVRAWDIRLGATYEDVVGRGLGGYGESRLLFLQAGGGGINPGPPSPLYGLQSFSLRPIPEPSAALLFLLGLPWLLWRSLRRR
jgi:hypothetical protein